MNNIRVEAIIQCSRRIKFKQTHYLLEQEALTEPERARCLARARLLADAAHAQTAATATGVPLLLPPQQQETAAARIAQRRRAHGAPPLGVSVPAAGVLEGVLAMPGDVFVELLDMVAMPWDPARRTGRRHR